MQFDQQLNTDKDSESNLDQLNHSNNVGLEPNTGGTESINLSTLGRTISSDEDTNLEAGGRVKAIERRRHQKSGKTDKEGPSTRSFGSSVIRPFSKGNDVSTVLEEHQYIVQENSSGTAQQTHLVRSRSDLSDDVSFEELVFTDDESEMTSRRRSSADSARSACENDKKSLEILDTSSKISTDLQVPQSSSKMFSHTDSSDKSEVEDQASVESQGSLSSNVGRSPQGVTPLFFATPKSLASGATYLDHCLVNNISPSMAHQFGVEHRLFIRAIIDILNERDSVGVEASMDDPNTIKSGKLKKASAFKAGWKTKYVELRMGIFTYYDEDPSQHETSVGDSNILSLSSPVRSTSKQHRKHIFLRASVCSCRAVSSKNHMHAGLSTGFIFELCSFNSNGENKRYFMTNTKEERQAWIRAIHESTIGGFKVYPPHRNFTKGVSSRELNSKGDIDAYLKLQSNIRKAKTEQAYLEVLAEFSHSPLIVPVVCIKEQAEASTTTTTSIKEIIGGDVILEFWKGLKHEVVSINGFVLRGDSGWGAERIIGTLTRCLLDFDRSFGLNIISKVGYDKTSYESISEAQAIAYARDVLDLCCRVRNEGDLHYCVETLCSNSDLVRLERQNFSCRSSDVEPLTINVSSFENGSRDESTRHEKSGWITSRSSSREPWKSRFCVLFEGNLTYFEKEYPSPHGLLEQVDLVGATIGVSEVVTRIVNSASRKSVDLLQSSEVRKDSSRFLVVLVTKDRSKERQLCFDDLSEFHAWKDALERAFKAQHSLCLPRLEDSGAARSDASPYGNSNSATKKRSGLFRMSRHSNNHDDDAISVMSGTENKGSSKGGSSKKSNAARSTTSSGHANHNEMSDDLSAVTKSDAKLVERIRLGQRPSVEVTVSAPVSYKILSSTNHAEDTNAVLTRFRAKLIFKFQLRGGPNGKLYCISEVLQLDLENNSTLQPKSDLS